MNLCDYCIWQELEMVCKDKPKEVCEFFSSGEEDELETYRKKNIL